MQIEPIAEEREPDFDRSQYLTISEVAGMTGLHKNTIRNYILRRELKATFIDNGRGKQKWVVSKKDLFTCGILEITARLDKDEIREMLDSEEKKELRKRNELIKSQKEIIEQLNLGIQESDEEIQELRSALLEAPAQRLVSKHKEEIEGLKSVIWNLWMALSDKDKRRFERRGGIELTSDNYSYKDMDVYVGGKHIA